MKILFFLSTTLMLLAFSCKNEEAVTVNETVSDIKQNTEVAARAGTGKITLNCNGKQIIAEGICGAVQTMGTLTIAVTDKTNPAKAFVLDFNTKNFPENGKEYTIIPKDYTAEQSPDNEVSASFTEGLPENKMNVWDSQPDSGKLIFSVNGNEIKCTVKNVRLQPSKMYNADDLQGEGTVSGEFTLYKN